MHFKMFLWSQGTKAKEERRGTFIHCYIGINYSKVYIECPYSAVES